MPEVRCPKCGHRFGPLSEKEELEYKSILRIGEDRILTDKEFQLFEELRSRRESGA